MCRISVGGVEEWRTFQAQSLIVGEVAHKAIMREKLIKEGSCQKYEGLGMPGIDKGCYQR